MTRVNCFGHHEDMRHGKRGKEKRVSKGEEEVFGLLHTFA